MNPSRKDAQKLTSSRNPQAQGTSHLKASNSNPNPISDSKGLASNNLRIISNKVEEKDQQEETENSPDKRFHDRMIKGPLARVEKSKLDPEDGELVRSKSNNQPFTEQIQTPYNNELMNTLQPPKP